MDNHFHVKYIETAGGVNAAKDIEGDYWTAVSYETLLQLNPEVIIVPSGATYSVQDILNDAIASKFNPFIEPTCGNCNNSGLAIS